MQFGFHTSISRGFSKVVEKAEMQGCETIQFFSRNPKQRHENSMGYGHGTRSRSRYFLLMIV
ncbi:MAG: hypothetical protein QME83_05685 [Thermodesulfobacteriota bacterium]|nr:hypothetical protein [Thermodesulfobacteriota bacterium]